MTTDDPAGRPVPTWADRTVIPPAHPPTADRASRPPRAGRPRASARPVARLAACVAALALVAACGGGDGDDGEEGLSERQAEVATRGEHVMPFDLDATTHRFEPVADGLVQTVVADDPTDDEQVGLVREHLSHEAERFAGGDFSDPASIHGDDMPGLADLEAGAEDIEVAYEPTPDGGRITYITPDASLVEALHAWAEAQLSDHGAHAEPG